MKKKHRDIVVDGVQYAWRYLGDYHGGIVKVWKDRQLLKEIDVDNCVNPITPGITEKLIRKFILNEDVQIPADEYASMEWFNNVLKCQCGGHLHIMDIETTDMKLKTSKCYCIKCKSYWDVNIDIVESE